MKRILMGSMGAPKVKKTRFAASVFDSTHLDPNKVLYFDNHDSTIGLELPEYSKKNHSGIYKTSDWDGVSKVLTDLQRKMARGTGAPLLDMIVLDDLTEQSALSVAYLAGEVGMNIPKWGEHKVFMSNLYRRVKMVSTHAIFVCRCDWQGDPNEKPDKGAPVDTRDQKMLPLLEGAFNNWFRYDVSLLAYQSKEVKATKIEFTMQLQPTKDVMVENRLWAGKPNEIVEPTFDKLWEIVEKEA